VIKSDTSSDTTPDKALIPYINIQTLKQETLKLLNENASLVDDNLKYWIKDFKLERSDFRLFEEAWSIYKRRGSKAKSKKLWSRLKSGEDELIVKNIPLYLKSVSEPKYIKHFENYLLSKTWEGEFVSDKNNEIQSFFGLELSQKITWSSPENITKDQYDSLPPNSKQNYSQLVHQGKCKIL